MKLIKFFSAVMLFAAITMASCDPVIPTPPPGPGEDTTKVDTTPVVIPDIDIPAEAITVAEAREICSKLESGTVTTDKYYVKGWVKKLHNKNAEGIASFGNAQFYMADNMEDKDDFMAYQVYGKNGTKITNENEIAEGDYVVIYGPLTNYNGTYETAGKGAAYIYSSSNANFGKNSTPGGEEIDIEYLDGELSVSQLLEQYGNLAGGDTTDFVRVRGVVKSGVSVALNYGTFTGYLTDGVKDIYCYGIAAGEGDANGFAKFVSAEQVKEGDVITVYARLYNYVKDESSTLELIKGYVTRTTNTFDPSTVTGPQEITIAEALALGAKLDQNKGISADQYIVTGGIVFKDNDHKDFDASTNYGNLTFWMKDDNDNEILVYRVYYVDNVKYSEEIAKSTPLEAGDIVSVKGQLQNYYGKIEIINGNLTEHVK